MIRLFYMSMLVSVFSIVVYFCLLYILICVLDMLSMLTGFFHWYLTSIATIRLTAFVEWFAASYNYLHGVTS